MKASSKTKKRLDKRIERFEAIPVQGRRGYTKPGSQNKNKK